MKKLGLLIVSLGLTIMVFSQTESPKLISSSGDSFKNTSFQLDWSIGECISATHNEGSYVITQGFHQDKYVITTALENLQNAGINISVFPNPTTDRISLKIESSNKGILQFALTDISGKILQIAELKSDIEQLNFSTYTKGVYFLTIKQENQLIKTFKVIKN